MSMRSMASTPFAALYLFLYPFLRKIVILERSGGYCQNCRYDLSGNISGICPECGTRISQEEA